MESFAILVVAATNHLSAVAIRVVSDTREGEIPVFVDAMLGEKGKLNASGIFRGIVLHPLQLPALIRLGRDSRTAAEFGLVPRAAIADRPTLVVWSTEKSRIGLRLGGRP